MAHQILKIASFTRWSVECWNRKLAIEASDAAGVPLQIISCTAPPPILRQRLAARTGDVSDAGPQLLESQLRSFEDFDASERPRVLHLETTSPAQIHRLAAELGLPGKNS